MDARVLRGGARFARARRRVDGRVPGALRLLRRGLRAHGPRRRPALQERLPRDAFDGPLAPVATKKLSGKQHYEKEYRAAVKAAVERDHADIGGKEKQALVAKALGEGWKALDDGAKAKWAADAPTVEVKKKKAKAPEPAPVEVVVVRGAVHVAWAPEDCVHFFRNRTVGFAAAS